MVPTAGGHTSFTQLLAQRLQQLQVNTTPEGPSQGQKAAAKAAAGSITPAAGQDNGVMDVLENTLWNRQLGVMSEEIVAALVCQICEGTLKSLSTQSL